MRPLEPLSGVDSTWLRMDDPTNLMTITGVLVLEDPIDVETFKEVLRERFLGFARFRKRVREINGTPHWEIDPHFDLDRHVHRSGLPGAAGQQELKARVSDLMGEPLDRSKPLWHMEVIEDYLGGSAIIVRLHHCIGDGIALVQVLLSLTDEHFDASRFPADESSSSRTTGVLQGLRSMVKNTASVGRRLITEGTKALLQPSHGLHRVKQGLSIGAAVSKYLLLDADSDTTLKGDLQVAQKVAWSDPLDLTTVKSIGHAIDAKVNDVLLGAVAGALHHYFEHHNEPTEGVTIRSFIPVNLRPPEEAFELGNHFGLVYLDLPVGLEDRLERVLTVKERMDVIKNSAEAGTTLGILSVLGQFPDAVHEKVVQLFGKKASAVITNVPGPQQQLHLKGRRVQHVMPWVPRAGRIALGVSIFSYNDEVRVGVACDAHLIPDPETIIEGFESEFDHLVDNFSLPDEE